MAGGNLDSLVRRVDPERWLASRFVADPLRRADVVALYAYDHELDRAGRVSGQPLIAEIRLSFWREALDEIFTDVPVRGHPVAAALAGAVRRHGLARAPLEAAIDGRLETLGRPLEREAHALAWAEAVGGSIAACAARTLDGEADAADAAPAGAVWGLLLRRRMGAPADADLDRLIASGLERAARAARRLSPAAFPAAACATLARGSGRRARAGLETRVRLLVSILRGRL